MFCGVSQLGIPDPHTKKNHFPIGFYFKNLSCDGGHLGFLITNKKFSENHIRNIPTLEQFHHNAVSLEIFEI